MAARGAQAKEAVAGAILVTFKDAFYNGKELRVPVMENGEEIQVKITLTAAKVNVPHGGKPLEPKRQEAVTPATQPAESYSTEPSDEELKNLEALLEGMQNEPSL